MAAFVWAAAGAGNWSVGGNWKVAGVAQAAPPTTSDTVTFGAGTGFTQSNCTLDVTGNVSTINFTGYTGTFTYSSQALNVSGASCVFVSGMTVTGNSSSAITISGASATFTGGAKSFPGTVSITGGGGATLGGINTFVNLTIAGTAAKTDSLTVNTNQTVTGTLTMGGASTQGINRIIVQASVINATRTITATGAAVVINGDVDFMDIAISGSPSWTNAGSAFVGDAGGNGSLITTNATTPASQTATGTASFTWSTHGWTSRVPLPQDSVSIPNAFIASQTITADMPRLGGSISFASGSGSPTFSVTVGTSIFGSLTMVSGVTISGTSNITFAGRSSYTLTCAGCTFTQNLILNAPGGTITLQDTFRSSRSNTSALMISQSTLTDNGQTLIFTGAASALTMNSVSGTLNASGTWNMGAINVTTFWSITNGTVNASTATIALTNASANARTFAGNGNTYGTLTYTVAGSTGQLIITGANSFLNINFSDATNARTLVLPSSTTTTITATHGLTGVVGLSTKLMSVNSSTGGTAATIAFPNGYGGGSDWLSVKDITATTNTWYAGANSTDATGNTNVTFSAPPSGATSLNTLTLLGVG